MYNAECCECSCIAVNMHVETFVVSRSRVAMVALAQARGKRGAVRVPGHCCMHALCRQALETNCRVLNAVQQSHPILYLIHFWCAPARRNRKPTHPLVRVSK